MDKTLFDISFGIEGELKPTKYYFFCGCQEPYSYSTICKYAADYVLSATSTFQAVAPNIFVTCDVDDFNKVEPKLEEYFNLTEGKCIPV